MDGSIGLNSPLQNMHKHHLVLLRYDDIIFLNPIIYIYTFFNNITLQQCTECLYKKRLDPQYLIIVDASIFQK